MQLRHDRDSAELPKVLVEGKRFGDAQLFHDDFAGTVGETPLFVGIAGEDLPGGSNVIFRQVVDRCQRTAEELLSYCERSSILTARLQERQRLIHHIIRGEERLTIVFEPTRRWQVLWVNGNRN